MKLQTKINLRFLLVILWLFAMAGVLFYFVLENVIDQNISEMLNSKMTNVNLYLQQNKVDQISFESPDRSIQIRNIRQTKSYISISDTLAYDEDEKQMIPFRKLIFSTSANGNYFEVSILQSLLESEDLQAVIFYFIIILFAASIISLFFINHWLSEKAWNPFFKSMIKLSSWKIGEKNPVNFDQTGISEFDRLNRTLEEMIQKMQTDFINLKEFTENASHEIQTPLAIAKSKLELVLTGTTLSLHQHKLLQDAFEAVNRLSKLNGALLLLSKIENRQFIEKNSINLCNLIQERMQYLEELFALKEIECSMQLDIPVIVMMHPVLADVLINNLLGNSLKHNFIKGRMTITSQNEQISFSNTGDPLIIDPSKLFQRFVKNSHSKDSTGLGLAIAYEICKLNYLNLNYSYSDQNHCFTLLQSNFY